MKTCNRFLSVSIALIVLCVANFYATTASAQYSLILPTQTFANSALPNGWSSPGGWSSSTSDSYNGSWFWNPTGNGGSNGAAMDDIWDYSSTGLTTPSVDVSSYATSTDSVWVDFDLFWEYNYYDYYYGDFDEFEIDGTYGEALVSGTVASMYTYYNINDFNYDLTQSSSSNWQHYHILIPVSDRTSSMTVTFNSNPNYSYGYSNAAVDNVKITAYPPPPVPELSLTPKSLNFGTATPNTPVTLYANVQNVGKLPLTITNTSLTGSNAYSVVSGPSNGTSVAAGSTVQYGLQFQPFNAGTLTGTFTVVTNGADSGTQTINLTGVGAIPAVSYSSNNMFRGVNTELTDTSGVQYLYVNSTGQGPLTVNSVTFIGIDAKAYIVSHLPSNSIPAGGVDSIGVRFIPDLEGIPDAHMVINSTAGQTPWDTVSLFGVGILPHLTIDNLYPNPITVNFDSVQLGHDSCILITLTNPGSDTLAIEKNYYESADFDFSITPLSGKDTLILPGASKNIQVCFTPLQQGYRLATIRINTNIPHTETKPPHDTSQFVINVIGTGVPSGKLMITGPATNGNTPVGTAACVTDTLWNTGSADMTVTGFTISGPGVANFTGTYPSTPFLLSANSHQMFTICATPSDTGLVNAFVTAYGTNGEGQSNSQSNTFPLSVLGTSVANTAVITTPFPTLTCGSDTAVITVTNTGNVAETYRAAVSGTNAAEFTVLPPTTSQLETGGGVATFSVVFTPTSDGTAAANLNITGGVAQTIPLSATGGAATIAGTQNAPATSIGSTSAQFTVTVKNTGTCDWISGTPTVDPQFTYVSGAGSIPAGGNAPFIFTYTPNMAGGTTYPVAFTGSTGLTSSVNVSIVTALDDVSMVSASNGYRLDQNYPNPFAGTSTIEITLPVAGIVHMSIVDVQGQTVQTVLNQHFDAGTFGVSVHADGLASGTYYYQMTAGEVTLTRQMVVIK
jgi:hypothetical protein